MNNESANRESARKASRLKDRLFKKGIIFFFLAATVSLSGEAYANIDVLVQQPQKKTGFRYGNR